LETSVLHPDFFRSVFFQRLARQCMDVGPFSPSQVPPPVSSSFFCFRQVPPSPPPRVWHSLFSCFNNLAPHTPRSILPVLPALRHRLQPAKPPPPDVQFFLSSFPSRPPSSFPFLFPFLKKISITRLNEPVLLCTSWIPYFPSPGVRCCCSFTTCWGFSPLFFPPPGFPPLTSKIRILFFLLLREISRCWRWAWCVWRRKSC